MEGERPDEDSIARSIHLVRGQKVMLDADLAQLYGVPDFLFQLTKQDVASLKSQPVTSSLPDAGRWGGRRKPINAFTEQGVAMLSSVLNSPRAISVNIAIMRTFVRLRLDELERRVAGHDAEISGIIRAIRTLATPPAQPSKRRIGFITDD